MRIRKVIHKPLNISRDGVNLAGGIDAVINANIQSGNSRSSVVSRQVTRVSQGGSRREAFDGQSRKDTGRDGEKEVEHD